MSSRYTLYGANISLFTGKVRSYLKYKGIPFEEVVASLYVYRTIIYPQTGLYVIPVVKIQHDSTGKDQYVQDTTVIIDTVDTLETGRPVMPSTPRQQLVSRLVETFADEFMVIPAMHYRWNMGQEQEDYIYDQFGKVVIPGWPSFLQQRVGRFMGAKFKGYTPKLGVTPETIPALENWYENVFLQLMDRHFAQYRYLLGDAASIGDFGLMGPLYAHLYLDPVPEKLMKEKAPHVVEWVERMNQTPNDEIGEWLANDEIPETLHELIQCIDQLQAPMLASTIELAAKWKEEHANAEKIPRFVGKTVLRIIDTEAECIAPIFSQWKWQRVQDVWKSMSPQELKDTREWLGGLSVHQLLSLLDRKIVSPVTRRKNKVVWADEFDVRSSL